MRLSEIKKKGDSFSENKIICEKNDVVLYGVSIVSRFVFNIRKLFGICG